MRDHEYEITRNDKDEVMGRVWWDGKKITADNQSIIHMLKGQVIGGKALDDGIEFLEKLPALFKSGYVTAKRIQ